MSARPYSNSHWRNAAAPVISKVLEDTKGLPEKEIRKALLDAYPFGQRKYHPYRIWCDEIRRQRRTPVKFVDASERLRNAFRLDYKPDTLEIEAPQ